MIFDTVCNDITSIKVLVLNKTSTKNIDHLLIKRLQLKELIPYFKNNNEIENKDDYTTFLNPSYYPESYMKFEYMKDSQDIEELLVYHDLEPWRNQSVVLTIEDGNGSAITEDSIIDNVYHKTICINKLSDINQYYSICENVFKIFKNYIKSLSYMKLKSPNNFMIKQTNKITYLNDSKRTENSNTYYQNTKAKYKINNMDLSVQLHSRKLKYISNILILSGQYKKAMEVLNDCVLELYKNGDFLWLSNALEMLIFCLINIVSITNDQNAEIVIPKCVDYLIVYDKHILVKTKIIKNMLKQVDTNGSSNRGSMDLEHNRPELQNEGHKNVLNIQSLVFLIIQIYEKLIHYLEYTYDEDDNYCTPNIFNSFIINYFWLLHQSIIYNDMNQFLTNFTGIKADLFDSQYLQPIQEDLIYQYKKYEMYNIFKDLSLRESLSFINLHLNMIDQLKNHRTLVLKFFCLIDKFKGDEEFLANNVLKERIFEKLFNLINNESINNKLILKKLITIIMKYSENEDTKTKLASLSLQNHFLFNADEQRLIFANLKHWNNQKDTCLLKSLRILNRSQNQTVLPKIENLAVLEQDDMIDEVYNPFRNRVHAKNEVVEIKHYFIENEVMSVELTFNNYLKIDLNLHSVIINNEHDENSAHFETVDISNKTLISQSESTVVIKFKCLNSLNDTFIDVNNFQFEFEEFENVIVKNVRPNKKKHPRNIVMIIPDIPILNNKSKTKFVLKNNCINENTLSLNRMNTVELKVFDIKIKVNDYTIYNFFNKKKLNKSEHELYEHMISEFYNSITITHQQNLEDLKLLLNFNFKDFKVVNASKFDVVILYGIVIENIKYISELNIPIELDYTDSLIIPNFEILPFNLIPSEQISLPTIEGTEEHGITNSSKAAFDNALKKDDNKEVEKWISFLEKNSNYKWILLLNLRNVTSSAITLNSIYKKEFDNNKEDAFKNDAIVINECSNRKVMIPIEASLFNDISQNQKSTGYNILMNFNKYLQLEYTLNETQYALNVLSNLKLEDCYNSQKLVNRQDISISMADGVNTFRAGESKRIRLEPKMMNKKEGLKEPKKNDNILISLMVLDIITSEDVLEKENTVLINGMRTFNIDQLHQQKEINIDLLFTIPGSYEINCLCEIGEDPSSVLKYFGTRALTVRVVQ